MSRSLVSGEELLAILNTRLQAREAAAGCVVVGPIKALASELADGGNWNRNLTIRGRPVDPQASGDAAHEVIEEVAKAYNLREPP